VSAAGGAVTLWWIIGAIWLALMVGMILTPSGRALLAWAYEIRFGSYVLIVFILALVVISSMLRRHWALSTATVVWLIVLALLYSGSLGNVSHVAAGAVTLSGLLNFAALAHNVYGANRERRRLYLDAIDVAKFGSRDDVLRHLYALGDAMGIAA
jgi:hypothetical protein